MSSCDEGNPSTPGFERCVDEFEAGGFTFCYFMVGSLTRARCLTRATFALARRNYVKDGQLPSKAALYGIARRVCLEALNYP